MVVGDGGGSEVPGKAVGAVDISVAAISMVGCWVLLRYGVTDGFSSAGKLQDTSKIVESNRLMVKNSFLKEVIKLMSCSASLRDSWAFRLRLLDAHHRVIGSRSQRKRADL